MKHTCEHCASAYEIPDERVAGRFLKVRCKRCKGTMHVVGLRALDAKGENGAIWWCSVANEPRGPFREDEVRALIEMGDVHERTRMWCMGMPGWERIYESETLEWASNHVIDCGLRKDARDPTLVFERAALLSEALTYTPDPTLHSGVLLLDEGTRETLRRLDSNALRHPSPMNIGASLVAAAVGAAAALGGIVWFIADHMT